MYTQITRRVAVFTNRMTEPFNKAIITFDFEHKDNAKSGRYVEGDPIGLAGGPSAYAYVANTPVSSRTCWA